MDKLKIFNLIKKSREETKITNKNNIINEKLIQKDSITPNKIPPNKTRTHIKIKSRDLNQVLNLNTENDIIYNFRKPQLRQNKTLNNLNTLKLNREKKLKINLRNRINPNPEFNFILKKNEIYKKILILWQELGVNYIYQSVFNKISNDLDIKERNDYFKYEFDKLSNIYNLINLIKNDIKNRENIIYQLQNNYSIENIENQNFNEETLKQIISIFNDIRKYSLDIVYNILLLKKDLGFDLSLNKYDINKIFCFQKDYIIKINSDLDFLINSPLNQYFSFEKGDPFFTKINLNEFSSYKFPEIKDEKKIYIMKNFKNIFVDELINQNLNLTNANNNKNFESIFNFKLFKPKKIVFQNNIIKAQRGLSKQKLRPKINNKIIIEANISNISKINNTDIIPLENKFNKKIFNRNINLKLNNRIKHNNITQLDEDMKIFEKIVEQKIFERQNNLTTGNNRNKSFNKLLKLDSEHKIENKSIVNKNENQKNQISNFIQKIFDESEIELSEKIKSNINTETSKENKIRKEYKEFIIELYNSKLSSLEAMYKDYYDQIPEKIKYGFNIQSSILKYINGIYPKILFIKPKKKINKLIGIVTINYISPNSNSISIGKLKSSNYNKILNISSISCIDESLFEKVLLNTIDFCQEFFYWENIFLELYYINQKGQFILETDLENIIKTKAKFKWVNMENDGINRKIKYKYVNNNLINNNNNEEIKENILNLKMINIMSFEEDNKYKKRDIRDLNCINDFCFNYLLLEMIGQQNYIVNDKKNNGNNYINNLINKVTFKKINHICSDFLISQVGNENEIKKFIEENKNTFNNNISEIIDKINDRIFFFESYFSISILNINNSFKNIIKRKYDGYLYNILFSSQISEFSIQDKKNNELIFYLIKNAENNSSIIIYELNEKQTFEDIKNLISTNDKDNADKINNNKNISEIFKDVFSLVNQKPMKLNKNIHIPSFKCEVNQMCFRPSVFSEVLLENETLKKKYKINCINFIEELTLGLDEPLNIRENIMELDSFINKDDIIIKHDFIINFVLNDLIFDLQIPTVATFFVEKKNWIKCD